MAAQTSTSRIQRLDEAVVNRIAAGEIIHRPSNALKELIENSLDAGSTSIQVSVKDGGLKLLQIQDNGHGIQRNDMTIVCERFTTSKLRSFDDLSKMTTYGFRGEALASISHIAHVTITTKTKDSDCAFKASYSDGKLTPAKPGANAEPKPCAGNNGTQITAEDLFYNVPTRRKALKNPTEEYNRILDVVNRYAIHNAGCSFTCRKVGSNTPEVHTTTQATVLDNIRQIYGSAVASELLSLEQTFPGLKFKASAWISNANYHVKKFAFLLFINHRSVDSPSIRKAIEGVYASYLPKNTHPWVYLSLEMEPRNVDVNVHPTKREVHFMHEEEIVAAIADAIQDRLGDANVSRNFMTQTLLPQLSQYDQTGVASASTATSSSTTAIKRPIPKVYEYNQVRTDSRAQTLDSFLVSTDPMELDDAGHNGKRIKLQSRLNVQAVLDDQDLEENVAFDTAMESIGGAADNVEGNEDDDMEDSQRSSLLSKIDRFKNSSGDAAPTTPSGSKEKGKQPTTSSTSTFQQQQLLKKPTRNEVKLTSVLQLREEAKKQAHPVLTPIFANHTFVAILDNRRGLIQNELALYLINYETVGEEMFYQLCLQEFSNFGYIKLSAPVDIKALVLLALQDEQQFMERDEWPEELQPQDEIADKVVAHLVKMREMLKEYFSICVTEKGQLTAIPMMIKGYVPNLEKLPDLLWRLGSEVDWTSEKECFRTIARELAVFFSTQPELVTLDDEEDHTNEGDGHDGDDKDTQLAKLQKLQDAHFHRMVSTKIFPAMKKKFYPPASLVDMPGVIVQVAQVKDLYKVFERC